MNRALLAIAAFMALASFALLMLLRPTDLVPPAAKSPAGGDFTLQAHDGPLSLAALRGKVVLLFFGYTYCPDICPTTLAAAAETLANLTTTERERVRTLFVSVDPERDTPARLKDYVAFFHPDIVGVTGTPQQVAEVARRYGVFYAKQDKGAPSAYTIDHTALIFVVAPDGRLVGNIPHGARPALIAAEIRKWLSSTNPGVTQ